MSRYMITQDQLERYQEQIQELRRMNALKDERIRELEVHKLRVSTSDVTDLLRTIATLEEDVSELQRTNRRLTTEAENIKSAAIKMKELEVLLVEERKLREYSETLAKHLEQIYNEEVLLRNLTTELCHLQKAEIEFNNKRVEDLQRKLKEHSTETDSFLATNDTDIKRIANVKELTKSPREVENLNKNIQKIESITKNSQGTENLIKNKQLKSVVQNLRKQLMSMYEAIEKKPVKTESDNKRLNELHKLFQETDFVLNDVNNIEELRKDLNSLRNEIESRRKSIVKFRS